MTQQTRHSPRKRFGQHFLHDQGVIRNIVAAVAPQAGENLLEIGPGQGAITVPMLRKAGALQVVELDRDLIPRLETACAGLGELQVHNADALKFDLRALAAPGPVRVIGNLPYNISTPLMFHLFETIDVIEDMHFLLQKEVVDRLAAEPGGKDYGRLSVMTRQRCTAQRLFDVGSGAFSPPPRVQSSFVRLTPWRAPPAPVDNQKHFAVIVNQAFSRRRKTLRNALGGLLDRAEIEAVDVDSARRPETLSLSEFAALANAFTASGKGQ